jgi:uncharacterized protein
MRSIGYLQNRLLTSPEGHADFAGSVQNFSHSRASGLELEGGPRAQPTVGRMSRRGHRASSAPAAMPLDELERWLQARAERRPVATGVAMLDGYVAAIVAGPVSISPLDWICPLLAIDADAFNHGGTSEFAAISAVVQRHNDISNTLSKNPDRFEPIHQRKPNGDVDARPWCLGFYAAMQPRLSAWAPLLDTRNINHGLLLPI